MSLLWLESQSVIALLHLLDGYYERMHMCKVRGLTVSNFYTNNHAFALEITRKKWLTEFPETELVLDRLEKRDPCFIPPESIHHDFLYYHLLCVKKETLRETDDFGPTIDYERAERDTFGKNATEYFSFLLS